MLKKPTQKREIYFDHAATTSVESRVLAAMRPYYSENYGNPSSLYQKGRDASRAITDARVTIAKFLHALPENIIFTGSGTESDNMAIYGVARAHTYKGKHIISTKIEHHAVLHPLEDLAKDGYKISYVKVNKQGIVDPKEVARAITPETVLVTIMYANNEIGSIEPIAQIGREILKYRKENNTVYPYFHTDACQAAGCIDLDVEKLHVDLMTINGSKIYGPKGVGLLYLRRGVKIKPLILGGAQENKLRAGTENVASIIGLAKALSLAQTEKIKESKRVADVARYLWQEVSKNIPNVFLNGPPIDPTDKVGGTDSSRLPNNVHITIKNIEGEAMLLYLDEYGIMCSTGSACTSESLDTSHVLMAIGLPHVDAHGSLRFTLGKENTKKDVDYLMKFLPDIVKELREISSIK